MTTRNNQTYKPLGSAGITILSFRFFIIVYSGILTILVFLIPSIAPLYITLMEVSTYLSWISSLLFMIFIFITFQRMDRNTQLTPENRNQVKIGIMSSLILIIILSIFGIMYFIFMTLYIDLGIISFSITMAYIFLYTLIALEILNGIFFLLTFLILSKILSRFEKLRDLRIFMKFTVIFGIFTAITHLFLGLSLLFVLLFVFIGISNPILEQIGLILTYSGSLFGGIAGICEIILSVGFILIAKRLQTIQ